MAKLTEFKTPTGATGNILSPSSWLQLILGSMVLIITFATAQNFTKKVAGRVPGLDTEPDAIFKQPTIAAAAGPMKQVF